jgi:hypothetical protein
MSFGCLFSYQQDNILYHNTEGSCSTNGIDRQGFQLFGMVVVLDGELRSKMSRLLGLDASIRAAQSTHFSGAHALTTATMNAAALLKGLVVCGGGLATAVLTELGCSALHLIGEVDTNVPICRAIGGAHEGLQVITKAGALGAEDILCTAVDAFGANVDLGEGVGRPILGITMGDPCGVGPEIIAKALYVVFCCV